MSLCFCRRFGRAGASVLQDGSASLIAGVDEEEEEEAEGGARGGGVDGKSSSQTRRPSQSGERKTRWRYCWPIVEQYRATVVSSQAEAQISRHREQREKQECTMPRQWHRT